ncbi:MAG: AbiH family protein [Bacteroidota bacterium]
MTLKNKIFLIGNGFDIAHNFKTKFSDFANYFLDNELIPELTKAIKNRHRSHSFFNSDLLNKMAQSAGGVLREDNYEDKLWHYSHGNHIDHLRKYLRENYKTLNSILNNSLLAKLYSSTDKNWFDIENAYFKELVIFKNQALKQPNNFDITKLQKLNNEFSLIKGAVKDYLNTLEIQTDEAIGHFLNHHFKDVQNAYVVNFNYTSTVKQYIENSEKVTVNHIHGSLQEDYIIFGYGNDQNTDYQEIKDLGIDEFLRHFKTFDYLNNKKYNLIQSQALEKYQDFEVFVLGHSLGLTDKTLLSEILNSDKCRKIHFFKRKDLENESYQVKHSYRELTYAASRIITNENLLRKKIVNFEQSTFFPN